MDPNDPVHDQLSQRWTAIRLYGTYEAENLAYKWLDKLQEWGLHPDGGKADDAYFAAAEYLMQIRKDLGVPEWKPAESPESKQATGQRKRDHGQ